MNTQNIWGELAEDIRNLFLRRLGPLAHLAGIWEGTGYTFIFRPDGQKNKPFFFQQNITNETLAIIPLIMSVTNRGADEQTDISLKGLKYEQLIRDATSITNILHFESGHWLLIPPTKVPLKNESIARQATILHGTAFTAIGDAPGVVPVTGKPNIITVDTVPKGPHADDPGYLDQFQTAPLIPGLPTGSIQDPSLILKHRLATQNVIDTVTFDVSAHIATTDSTDESGGISNIPFLNKNAQVTNFRAVLYVEHVEENNDVSFMQLQYIQSTMLNFDNINWPHVSVATLRRLRLS
jgi:hypothetical protein